MSQTTRAYPLDFQKAITSVDGTIPSVTILGNGHVTTVQCREHVEVLLRACKDALGIKDE